MTISCPICGAEELTKKVRERKIPIEFGRDIKINETIYSCSECEMEGDFFNENDRKIEAALVESKKETSVMILDDLSTQNISMAYFERAMSLPTRTLNRWKMGKVSAPAFALMKTVKTFPWVLDVAAKRFDHAYAMDRMLEAAADEIGRRMNANNITAQGSVVADIDSAEIKVNLRRALPLGAKIYLHQEAIGQ